MLGGGKGLGEGNGVPVNQELDRAGRGEGRERSWCWCWNPSPGWSHLMATVVDGGWPWQERQPSHAPILMRALGSCLCLCDHKNSWDKFLAHSASLCSGWCKRCRRVGQKVLESWRGTAQPGAGWGMRNVLSLFPLPILHEVQNI